MYFYIHIMLIAVKYLQGYLKFQDNYEQNSMFSRSSCSMVLSTMSPEVALYRKYIWRPSKPEVALSQHIGQLETKFQHLLVYFRCHSVQRRCRQNNRKSHTGNTHGSRPYTGSKCCLSLHDSCQQNSNCYIHLSEVMQFNGVVDDTTGYRDIPEIDMTGNKTGSDTILAHRTA